MNTRFDPLFTLGIEHGYYGGACPDFEFVVTPTTARVLAGGRMLARVRDGQLHVLAERDETGASLVPPAGRTLRFGLRLLNASFANFTALPPGCPPESAIYSNAVDPDALAGPYPAKIVGSSFRHDLLSSLRPLDVTLQRADGTVLHHETVEAADGRTSLSFELPGAEAGIVFVLESAEEAAQAGTRYFLDAESAGSNLFGIVIVTVAPGFEDAPAAFRISFEAREEALEYYVVAHEYPAPDFAQLAVSDGGFGPGVRGEIQFDRIPAADFGAAELPREALEAGGGSVVLFRSRAEVARAQGGLRKLRLVKNGETLIEDLPLPRPENTKSTLVVHVSKT